MATVWRVVGFFLFGETATKDRLALHGGIVRIDSPIKGQVIFRAAHDMRALVSQYTGECEPPEDLAVRGTKK
jgi:hypothetical protein